MDKSIYGTPWFVYIAECRDRTLYVGIVRDVRRRVAEHNNSKKCRYTRFRKPLKLVYEERYGDYNTARKKESQIKKFSRKKKQQLIEESGV